MEKTRVGAKRTGEVGNEALKTGEGIDGPRRPLTALRATLCFPGRQPRFRQSCSAALASSHQALLGKEVDLITGAGQRWFGVGKALSEIRNSRRKAKAGVGEIAGGGMRGSGNGGLPSERRERESGRIIKQIGHTEGRGERFRRVSQVAKGIVAWGLIQPTQDHLYRVLTGKFSMLE